MNGWKRWVIVVGVTIVASAAAAAPVGAVAVIDRPVARVGDAVIWDSDIAPRLRGREARERAAVIDELIDDELVLAEGRRAGLTVSDSDVRQALDEIKHQNQIDDAGLDAALEQAGYTRPRYLVELGRQLLILRTKHLLLGSRVTITDQDVDTEVARRRLPAPVSEDDRAAIQSELRQQALDAEATTWLAQLRSRAWIERRP
jgi:peptidyl-prolyl cis-trans isomerase SurA